MKLCTFRIDGREHLGLVTPKGVVDASSDGLRSVDDWLRLGKAAHERVAGHGGQTLDAGRLDLGPAVSRPSKILAIGQNYADHAREQGKEPPKRPLVFAKLPSAIIGPGQTIVWDPNLATQVDWEAELAVVIGKRTRHATRQQAMASVAGYAVANDVTARDLQRTDGQWVRAKGFDTFCPISPVLVTVDEVPDPHALRIGSRVNGHAMQDSNTDNMVFSIDELIRHLSQAFTLYPGDVILTGTPHGVGAFRDPPIFLKDGDRVEAWVDGVGSVANVCRIQTE